MTNYKIAAHTVIREMDGKAVALNLDSEQYYTLNEVGLHMWALLQEKDSLASAAAAVEAEYDVTREQAAADLESFLKDLLESGLVEQTST